MKRKIIVFFSILFTINSLFAQTKDFRSINWGMNRDQIKAIEKEKILLETEKYVAYETKVSGFPVWLVYNFINDKCVNSRYMIKVEHANDTLFVDDYKKLKSLLIKVYGNPIEDETIWKDDLYKDDETEYGMALSIGDLFYYTNWENDKTFISLELGGDNYEIDHFIIFYDSKEFSSLAEEKKAEEETEGL
ncbi:MAG TPA: hypothetical protein DIT55_05120 [Spirochaetaceae bacterium]|nr:hypothetical protein [Spirochaetaceae bacterium]